MQLCDGRLPVIASILESRVHNKAVRFGRGAGSIGQLLAHKHMHSGIQIDEQEEIKIGDGECRMQDTGNR